MRARRVLVDSVHHDVGVGAPQLVARLATPLRKVSGLRLLSCTVPRYHGPMCRAVLAATTEDGKAHYLHAFAPQTSTLAEIGAIFCTHLEEDSRRATTGSFSSPWFSSLTIKATPTGFTVLEYYESSEASLNVKDVALDVTLFDGLSDTVHLSYASGLVANLNEDGMTPVSYTKGLWFFSQLCSSVSRLYGDPVLCVQGAGALECGADDEGSVARTPQVTLSSAPGGDAAPPAWPPREAAFAGSPRPRR